MIMGSTVRREHKITNCPNCGAVVAKTGKCAYCGTFIRIANSIDVSRMDALVDMQINIWDGDKVTILPFGGTINDIRMEYPVLAVVEVCGEHRAIGGSSPEIELTISGFVND